MENGTIFVQNLPTTATLEEVAAFFGQIGVVKINKKTRQAQIHFYKNKETGENNGECTVTYEDNCAAEAAPNFFNDVTFAGTENVIKVTIAESRKEMPQYGGRGGDRRGGDRRDDRRGDDRFGGDRHSGGGGGGGAPPSGGRPGDWVCECGANNFARRTDCFKCHKPKAGGAPGAGGGGAMASDWNCLCGNTNWARRSHCNMCNAPRPGLKMGGDAGGDPRPRRNERERDRDFGGDQRGGYGGDQRGGYGGGQRNDYGGGQQRNSYGGGGGYGGGRGGNDRDYRRDRY